VSLGQVSQSVFVGLLHFSLSLLKLLISLVVLDFLVFNIGVQIIDLSLLSLELLLDRGFFLLLFDFNLASQVVDILYVLILFLLLDQDLVGLWDLAVFLILLGWVFVNDGEDSKHTILTC